MVVRDDLGRVVAALSKRINAPLGAVEVELRLSKQVYSSQRISGCRTSFWKVIPSESIIIERALSRLVSSSSSVDSLVSCMQELCGEFSGASFSHVRCQGNRETHLLAKYAMDIIDFST